MWTARSTAGWHPPAEIRGRWLNVQTGSLGCMKKSCLMACALFLCASPAGADVISRLECPDGPASRGVGPGPARTVRFPRLRDGASRDARCRTGIRTQVSTLLRLGLKPVRLAGCRRRKRRARRARGAVRDAAGTDVSDPRGIHRLDRDL